MTTYYDYAWYGAPQVVNSVVENMANVIGPIVLDGVAYVTIRSTTPIDLPAGLRTTGPDLSTVLLGTWQGDPTLVPLTITNAQGRATMAQTFITEGEFAGRSLLTAVDTYFRNQITATAELEDSDPIRVQAVLAWQYWEQSNVFERNSQMFQALSPLFGFTEEQVDQLFIASKNLSA